MRDGDIVSPKIELSEPLKTQLATSSIPFAGVATRFPTR